MARSLLDRFVYFPMCYPEGDWDAQERVGAADISLISADGIPLHAWWFRSDRAELATLFLHGNAGNVTHRIEHALKILDAGSSALILDYRGYGKSGGVPSEHGLYTDAAAGYEWLIAAGIPADKIVLHGESIGSAVATELASRRRCAALVLEAPFTSLTEMANAMVPFFGGFFIRGFDTLRRLKSVHVPVFVIHGDADDIVPISQGKKVFAAANDPKTFWPVHRAGHNDLLEWAGKDYVAQLRRLYGSVMNIR